MSAHDRVAGLSLGHRLPPCPHQRALITMVHTFRVNHEDVWNILRHLSGRQYAQQDYSAAKITSRELMLFTRHAWGANHARHLEVSTT